MRRDKYATLWERTRIMWDMDRPGVEMIEQPWGIVPQITYLGPRASVCNSPLRKHPGRLCKWGAGAKTDHKGVGRCTYHGGNTLPGQVEGFMVMAHAYALEFNTTPPEALQAELQRTEGAIRWLQEKLSTADEAEDGDLALVRDGSLADFVDMYDKQRGHLVRVAVAAINSGVTQLLAEDMQRKGERIAEVMDEAIAALGLDPIQEDKVRTKLAMRLRQLGSEEGSS